MIFLWIIAVLNSFGTQSTSIQSVPPHVLHSHVLPHLSDQGVAQISAVSKSFYSSVKQYKQMLDSYSLENSESLLRKLINQPNQLKSFLKRFVNQEALVFKLLESWNDNDKSQIIHRLPSQIFSPYFGRLLESESPIDKTFINTFFKLRHISIMEWNLPDSTYYGQMSDKKPEGFGFINFPGTRTMAYSGEWKDGSPDGHGIRFYPNGQIYHEGEFEYGMATGYGSRFHPYGYLSYEGHFQQDKYHGYGESFVNGRKAYQGEWRVFGMTSKRTGFGIEYDLESGQIKRKGLWLGGKLRVTGPTVRKFFLEYFDTFKEHYPLVKSGPVIEFLVDEPLYMTKLLQNFETELPLLNSLLQSLQPSTIHRVVKMMPLSLYESFRTFLQESSLLKDHQFIHIFMDIPTIILDEFLGLKNVIYHGDLKEALPHGFGQISTSDQGERTLLYIGSSTAYDYDILGEWKDGLPFGNGILFKDGHVFQTGNFILGKLNGEGQELNEDGTLAYVGSFKDGLYHGKGSMFKNGKLFYKGQFKLFPSEFLPGQSESKRHGWGMEYDLESPIQKVKMNGMWENDVYIPYHDLRVKEKSTVEDKADTSTK